VTHGIHRVMSLVAVESPISGRIRKNVEGADSKRDGRLEEVERADSWSASGRLCLQNAILYPRLEPEALLLDGTEIEAFREQPADAWHCRAEQSSSTGHENIDLIVAGAYGRSRLGEWAFGGVTRDLLTECRICCLFWN
jgi:hypothetical protein